MTLLNNEVDHNYHEFTKKWLSDLEATQNKLSKSDKIFKESYRRLTTFQAWRAAIFEPIIDDDSAAFFVEAHNDALVSHVMARSGAFRVALQSLRSSIENSLLSVYYMDHPVELEQWNEGVFKIGFRELIKYFNNHPRLAKLHEKVCSLNELNSEYEILSKAVHGSAKNFRMTPGGRVSLWSSDKVTLNKWQTRERSTVMAINSLLICIFRDDLQGTANGNLRKSLGFLYSSKKRDEIKTAIQVNIPKP